VSTSGCSLDGKQVREQLHDDPDSFNKISQDSDIDMIERSDPDAEISRPDLGDSGGNSDDSHGSVNVGVVMVVVVTTMMTTIMKVWLWDENDHNFCGYKPHRSWQMPVSPCKVFLLFLMQHFIQRNSF
jgi:hypothetical protein